MNSIEQPAVGAPVEATVRPRAWAVAASYWGPLESIPASLVSEAEPLYDQAALDAAVAAERERCAAACEHFAVDLRDAKTAEALRDMAALMRALGHNVRAEPDTTAGDTR